MVNKIKYYKIISGYSNNEFKVSCLVFEETPFAICVSKGWQIFSESFHWEFSSLDVEYMLIKNFNDENGFKEISEKEWEEAFDNYCKGVKELKWEKEK